MDLSFRHPKEHVLHRSRIRITDLSWKTPSAYCGDILVNVYQNLIGILRWMCELGRIDILHEVSILSQYLPQPCTGHLQQVINIFHYATKKYNRSWIVLDPTRLDIYWIPTKPGEVHPEIRAKAMKDIYTDAQAPHT